MRTMSGLPQISDSSGNVGFGGPQLKKRVYFGESILEKKSEDIIFGLDSLIAQTGVQLSSYAEICSTYEKKRDIINRTPTIKPMKGYYSSPFGKRIDPFTQRYTMHEGIDIVAPEGTPIYAAADGVVNFADWYHGYGNTVVINHKLYKTKYAHLSKISVKRGQKVKRGDIIGSCGRTGKATANHLHYEVHVNNKPVDPMDYIFPTDYTYD